MSPLPHHLLEEALAATRETDRWDFKREVDLTSTPDFLEIVKDIVAFANSGGGIIMIGVDDDGISKAGLGEALFQIDPANITNKIFAYTGIHFHSFEFMSVSKQTVPVCAVLIGSVDVPMVFTRPGTYAIAENKQKSAFAQGTVYFRHGAKSEPGTSDDLRQFIARYVERTKASLLDGISKVIHAPNGSQIAIVQEGQSINGQDGSSSVRVTYEADAPEYRAPLIERTHPHRQKELLIYVNERLNGVRRVSTHDFLCVRRVHNIHRDLKYCYNLNWSSPRYSDACIEWLVTQVQNDTMFLHRARESYSEIKVTKKK